MVFLRISSAFGILFSAIAMCVCWILAIGDEEIGNEIRGCIALLGSGSLTYDYGNFYEVAADDYRHLFFGGHKRVSTLCLITIIVFLFLPIITAIMARYRDSLYLITGILESIIFLCFFTLVIDRTRYNKQCEYYKNVQRVKGGNADLERIFYSDKIAAMKNIYKSYEFIWGSSIAFIIASAYQIGCAIVLIYRGRKKDEAENEPKVESEPEPLPTPERQTESPRQVDRVVQIGQSAETMRTGIIDENKSEPTINLGISNEHPVDFESSGLSSNGTSIDPAGVNSDRD